MGKRGKYLNNTAQVGTKSLLVGLVLVLLGALSPSQKVNGQIINNHGAYFNITPRAVVGSRHIFNSTGGNLFNFGTLGLSGNFTNYAMTMGNGLYRLDGNWTNAGIFNQGTSTVLFKGAANQTITGTGSSLFYNLSVANTGAPSLYRVIINNNVTVTDTLSMAEGNIDAQSYLLYLSSTKAKSLNYSSTTGSRVFGSFKRGVGEQGTYLFPLGTNHYNPITITTNTTPTSGTILSRFFPTNPGSGGLPIADPPVEIWGAYPDGFWRLTAGDFFSVSNFDVTLDAEGFADPIFPSTRLLTRSAGDPWTVDGQHVDADTVDQKVVHREELTSDISPSGTEFAVGRLRALIIGQPIDTTVCETTDATFSVTATGIQTLRYFWYRLVEGTGIQILNAAGEYSGARTNTLTIINTQLADIGDYFCIIRDRNNNTVSTDTVHLHVNKIPIATVSISEQEHECSNIDFEDIALGFSWWNSGSTFVWERDNPTGIVSAIPITGTANNIGDVLEGAFTNTTDVPVTVTFTIVPVGPAPTFCTGLPIQSTVTVNPIPRVIVADTISSICFGEDISVRLTTPTQMTSGVVQFNYTVNFTGTPGDVVGVSAPGYGLANNTLLDFDYKNYADTLNSVYFHVTPVNIVSGCDPGVIVSPEIKVHPIPLRSSFISEPFTCEGGTEGELTAILAKSSKPNTVNWTGPWNINETYITYDNSNQFAVRYNGQYKVTVTDDLNCTATSPVIEVFGTNFVTLFSAIKTPTNYGTTCFDTDDGRITIGESLNSEAPFEYWLVYNQNDTLRNGILSNRGVYRTETGLAAGSYQLVIRDNNGCYNGLFPTERITEPKKITISSFSTSDYGGYDIRCSGYDDGSVWVSPSAITGGNGGYNYEWFDSEWTLLTDRDTLSNVTAGKYYVRVTDKLGCIGIDSVVLDQPDGMVLSNVTLSTSNDNNYNISCLGGNDGSIELEISGGLGTLSYSWTNGEGYSATTEDIYNLASGVYTITATDQYGCELKTGLPAVKPVFTLTEPERLALTASLSESDFGGFNINCYGGTGSIDITVTGGSVGNYIYKWSTTTGSGVVVDSEDQSALTAGTYQLIVEDLNGCIIDTTFTLTEPSPLGSVANPTHITCFPLGFNNGSIDLVPTGGVEPYGNFLWSNGATTEDISGLTAGTYTVSFTDANGCVRTDFAEIELPADLTFTKKVSNYNGFNVSCWGSDNGWIKINVVSGKAPYIFNWSKEGGGFESNADSISGLTAGRYILHIVDANLCESTEIIEITEPGPMELLVDLSTSLTGGHNINCYGDSTGTINVSPVNNVGSVSYLWSDGFDQFYRVGMSAGIYGLIVTDENYCAVQTNIEITQPDIIALNFNMISPWCPDKPDGSVEVNVTGGVKEYEYLWSDLSTDNKIQGVSEGFFSVKVTDANGCVVEEETLLESQNESCLVIPNTISPNGDLINDYWNLDYTELYPEMEIKIMNRWGITVWKSEKGYPVPWDGKNSRGRELPIDSYHYIIDFGDNRRPQIGSITIVK